MLSPTSSVLGRVTSVVSSAVTAAQERTDSSFLAQQQTLVVMSRPAYWLCWWLVLLGHVTTALFVCAVSFVHLVLSVQAIAVNTSALLIPLTIKRISGFTYLALALLHLIAITNMVAVSIRNRRLTLARPSRQASDASPVSLRNVISTSAARLTPLRHHSGWLTKQWANLLGLFAYIGIDGPFFVASLLFRELLEVAMQSYQLWTLSYAISRAWINQFAVAAVLANCWSIPIVNKAFSKREGIRRLMHLVVDMFLDFICSVVIPVCILSPYVAVFDWKNNEFPMKFILDDLWFTNAVAESSQVLVTSYPDFFSSLLPQYSIFSCLRVIKRLVKRAPPTKRHRSAVAPVVRTATSLGPSASAPHVLGRSARTVKEETASIPASPLPEYKESRGARLTSVCIALWGGIVLSLHIKSAHFSGSAHFPGCKLYVRPWFATNVSCVVQHINCHRLDLSGAAHQIEGIFNQLENTVVTKIVLSHCPAIHMPSYLVHFSGLRVVEIINSTLVEWSMDAAIKWPTHPAFTTALFIKSNVSAIPDAFLHRDLPMSLAVIGFHNCSLAELPDDLGDLWGSIRLSRLGLENTHVRTLPVSMGRMPLQKLWVTSNLIEEIPDDLFANARFGSIRLSGNPLKRLPANIGDVSKLTDLLVEQTNITSLPKWASTWLDAHKLTLPSKAISFYGSPVCETADSSLAAASGWDVCRKDIQSQFGWAPYETIKDKYPF